MLKKDFHILQCPATEREREHKKHGIMLSIKAISPHALKREAEKNFLVSFFAIKFFLFFRHFFFFLILSN